MKKKYNAPTAEVLLLQTNDIIIASGGEVSGGIIGGGDEKPGPGDDFDAFNLTWEK